MYSTFPTVLRMELHPVLPSHDLYHGGGPRADGRVVLGPHLPVARQDVVGEKLAAGHGALDPSIGEKKY